MIPARPNNFPAQTNKFPVLKHGEFDCNVRKLRLNLDPFLRNGGQILRNSLLIPCLQGNLTGDRLVEDCVHHHPVLDLQYFPDDSRIAARFRAIAGLIANEWVSGAVSATVSAAKSALSLRLIKSFPDSPKCESGDRFDKN